MRLSDLSRTDSRDRSLLKHLEMEREKKILKVQVGGPFQITLWEDRTHGHSWQPIFDSIPVQLVDDDYVRTIHVDTADFGEPTQ